MIGIDMRMEMTKLCLGRRWLMIRFPTNGGESGKKHYIVKQFFLFIVVKLEVILIRVPIS